MYVHARSSVMVRSRAQLILFVHSWTGKNFVYVTENTRITRRCIFKSKIAAHCWAILVLFGSPFYGDLPGRYTCFSRLLPPKSLSRAEKTMFLYIFLFISLSDCPSCFLFEVRNPFQIKFFLFKSCFDREWKEHRVANSGHVRHSLNVDFRNYCFRTDFSLCIFFKLSIYAHGNELMVQLFNHKYSYSRRRDI